MIGRVLEIQEDGRYLSLYRGFLVVSVDRQETARVPLDDIAVLIANAHQITYSHALLLELNRRGIAFMACGSNHLPVAVFWPVDGHHQQAGIMRAQAQAGQPLCKQLWKRVVQAKILFQQETLEAAGVAGEALQEMARRVRSGDPDNLEAQAARRYWPLLMGKSFTRDRTAEGGNALLNYGYAIIRSGVARAVMAAGLHPSLGIFHRNRLNPMCLVDDLMEPFRPRVDWEVWTMQREGLHEVNAEAKKRLALLLLQDCTLEGNASPLSVAMFRMAQSLAQCLTENLAGAVKLPDKRMLNIMRHNAADAKWIPDHVGAGNVRSACLDGCGAKARHSVSSFPAR
jgi:CRISPR-associated protein Cas1